MFLHSLLMQEAKRPPKRNKRWYGRIMEVIILWKSLIRSSSPSSPSSSPAAAAEDARLNEGPVPGNSGGKATGQKLRKCASLKVASSFTRVCLCAPISSYNNEALFRSDALPRRSYSYPRSNSSLTAPPEKAAAVTRSSVEGARRVFRGKSLSEDILMRRFVVAEGAMLQQVRRRNQMDFIRRRNARRRKIGPSPLSRMAMAEDEEEEEEEEEQQRKQ